MLFPFLILLAQGPYDSLAPAAPAVRLIVSSSPESPWSLETDPKQGKIVARLSTLRSLALYIDCDDHRRDKHYEGITIQMGGRRLEGLFHGSTVSFLSVDHDAGPVHSCAVSALDGELRVRFENGSYRNLHPAGPDLPVFFETVFRVDKERRLTVYLNGLYYLFGHLDGTAVTLPGVAPKRFTRQSAKTIEYFERVVGFEVADPHFGSYSFQGLVERLQFQVHASPNTDLFEFDFDHAYKDRGQHAIPATLKFKDPLPQQ
jgi:hypothetical protein